MLWPGTREAKGFCAKGCIALALTEGRCRQVSLEGGLVLAQ